MSFFDEFPREKSIWHLLHNGPIMGEPSPSQMPDNLRSPFRDPLTNLIESCVDNIIRDQVITPAIGSVVYCDLLTDILVETKHTGIYIGGNQIVHLNGEGYIEAVSPHVFLARLDGWNTAISIYTSCQSDGTPCGFEPAAHRARQAIGKHLDYALLSRNCHQFTAGCLTGHFENNEVLFGWLRDLAEKQFKMTSWHVWNFNA